MQTFNVGNKECVALVRKLTPRECLRLMGVDDRNIDKLIEAREVDDAAKQMQNEHTSVKRVLSNSSLYKLAGNSIVVDVLYHIFRKAFVERGNEAIQLGLFDTVNEAPCEYTSNNPLRVVTLCSGYDSQCLALERLKADYPPFDYELIAWSEIDPAACKAHDALFPQWADRNLGDMTKIDWERVPDFDLLFYSTPCFVAGTLVLTDKGYKSIEDVKIGDMVMTHNNRFRKVVDAGKKPAKEIVKIRSMMFDEIFCTPNHPFYTRKRYRKGHKSVRCFAEPVWKAAQELTSDDYLGLAINTNEQIPEWNGVALHRGTHWDVANELQKHLSSEYFWYLMGRYIGDGWQRNDETHKSILVACSDRNKDVLLQTIETLGWRYTLTKEKTCYRVMIYSKELCEFVNRYGKYAHNKCIDAETMNLPLHLLNAFLQGYVDSDGCYVNTEYEITTTSKKLAYGLMQIVAKVHKRPSRIYKVKRPDKYIIEDREVNQRNSYMVVWHTDKRKQDKAFYEDGYVWFPIKEITSTNRKEFVYNLEVEEDHSYTANGAIVHNCQSISQAGLQHGFTEGSGTRSSIIWNVRDALITKRPRYACLENVAAMVSQKFLPMFNLWQTEIARLGYTNYGKVLNAKDYGVPQNRERIFLWSVLGDVQYHFPEPMPLTKQLKDILEDEVDTRFYLNPERVQEFVRDNIDKVTKYASEGIGEIEPMPEKLREWIENYEKKSITTDK